MIWNTRINFSCHLHQNLSKPFPEILKYILCKILKYICVNFKQNFWPKILSMFYFCHIHSVRLPKAVVIMFIFNCLLFLFQQDRKNKYVIPVNCLLRWYSPTYPFWNNFIPLHCFTKFNDYQKFKDLPVSFSTRLNICLEQVYAFLVLSQDLQSLLALAMLGITTDSIIVISVEIFRTTKLIRVRLKNQISIDNQNENQCCCIKFILRRKMLILE